MTVGAAVKSLYPKLIMLYQTIFFHKSVLKLEMTYFTTEIWLISVK